MAGEVLHVGQRHALREQVGDGRHAEAVRADLASPDYSPELLEAVLYFV